MHIHDTKHTSRIRAKFQPISAVCTKYKIYTLRESEPNKIDGLILLAEDGGIGTSVEFEFGEIAAVTYREI